MGAALTALNFGIPGLSVSQEAGERHEWETAATLAAEVAALAVAMRLLSS